MSLRVQILRAFLVPVIACMPLLANADELLKQLKNSPHRIVYEAYQDDTWDLFVMCADGSEVSNLTKTPKLHELYPQASPNGKQICFLQDEEVAGEMTRSVALINADGSGRQLVSKRARQPCWSPAGDRIAFVAQEFSRFDVTDYVSKGLFIYDVKTNETRQHPNAKIHHIYNLSWSADGHWILATVHGGMGFGHAILALEVAGDRVIDLGIPGCRPCVSSSGTRITWSSDDHTISVAQLHSSKESIKVTDAQILHQEKKLHLYHPDFSPDEKFVSFSGGPGGRVRRAGPGTYQQLSEMIGVKAEWNIYVKALDSTHGPVQLTKDSSLSSKESEWIRGE